MERNCQKCIHHISGLCSKWECEMTTLEDYRNKVIDEFAEKLKKKYPLMENDLFLVNDVLRKTIDEIAEQMKVGGK